MRVIEGRWRVYFYRRDIDLNSYLNIKADLPREAKTIARQILCCATDTKNVLIKDVAVKVAH
jgi:hypothetical protein